MTDMCSACGHYAAHHEHGSGHCLTNITGLNLLSRRCTCTFVRIAGRSAADA